MKLPTLKREKKFRKGGFHTNPNIGWELVLFLALLIAGALFAWGTLMFLDMSKEIKAPSLGEDAGKTEVDKERIEKVLEYFRAREKKSREIISTPAAIVDPSL